MNRRKFFESSAIGAAAVVSGASASAAKEAPVKAASAVEAALAVPALADVPKPEIKSSLPIINPSSTQYLRPLPQPLFDSEWIMPDSPVQCLRMFQRPIGMNFAYRPSEFKGKMHSNMYQPNMLPYPLEFSLNGFNVVLPEGLVAKDRSRIADEGVLEFTNYGGRVYLQLPLCALLQFHTRHRLVDLITGFGTGDPPSFDKVEVTDEVRERLIAEQESEADSDYFSFKVGKHKLHIKSAECFGVNLTWKDPLVVSMPVLLHTFMRGLTYFPM